MVTRHISIYIVFRITFIK